MMNEVRLEVAQVVSALDDGADRVRGLVVDRKQPTSARRMGGDADDDDIGDGDAASGLGDGRDEAILDSIDVVSEVADVAGDGDGGRDVLGVLAAVARLLTARVLV